MFAATFLTDHFHRFLRIPGALTKTARQYFDAPKKQLTVLRSRHPAPTVLAHLSRRR